MDDPLQSISLTGLAIAFIPALVVIGIFFRWALDAGTAIYGMGRMLVQLLVIGYVLTFIFETRSSLVVVGVLLIMLTAACWISMRPIVEKGPAHYLSALFGIVTGGVSTLALVTALVLDVSPWFEPRYVVPIAGMIFAGSMNAVSLAGERMAAETLAGKPAGEARSIALRAALIPTINSLFAVGLVALPGMMTGQILSGISPLIAARYQIVVMCMLFGASGISAAVYLISAPYRERQVVS